MTTISKKRHFRNGHGDILPSIAECRQIIRACNQWLEDRGLQDRYDFSSTINRDCLVNRARREAAQ